MKDGSLGVAFLGAGWISRVYGAALQRAGGATLVAVASRTREAAEKLAGPAGAKAYAFDELGALLADPRVELVCVNSPNRLHAEQALAALEAGRHVVVEKPLCLTLDEADRLCAAAARHGRVLGYAENLCFAPLYRRARELIREGTVGKVHWARQVEKHGGPYSPWFFAREDAGGGALMDMGCHGIEALRFVFERPQVAAVSARLATTVHADETSLDDDAVVTLELASGAVLVSESSWAVKSGMQSTLEVHGSEGTLFLDLMGETGLRLAKKDGGATTRPMVDPLYEHGYVGELAHFVAAANGAPCEETGEDGRAVLEILLAAYASAGQGGRAVPLPFRPTGAPLPVDLWKR